MKICTNEIETKIQKLYKGMRQHYPRMSSLTIILLGICFIAFGISRRASAEAIVEDAVYYDGIPFSVNKNGEELVYVKSLRDDLKLEIQYSLQKKSGTIIAGDKGQGMEKYKIIVNQLDYDQNLIDVAVYNESQQLIKTYTDFTQLEGGKFCASGENAESTLMFSQINLAISVLFTMALS